MEAFQVSYTSNKATGMDLGWMQIMSPCGKPHQPYEGTGRSERHLKAIFIFERVIFGLRETSTTLCCTKTAPFSWMEGTGEKRPQW